MFDPLKGKIFSGESIFDQPWKFLALAKLSRKKFLGPLKIFKSHNWAEYCFTSELKLQAWKIFEIFNFGKSYLKHSI